MYTNKNTFGMKKINLKIEWKTNEYYDIDDLTLTLTDEKIAAIEKAQSILVENRDFDSIRVMIDENCIKADSALHRLGYGFVLVRAGDQLYFVGTDHYDSANQVETDGFVIDEMIEFDDGIPEEPNAPENFSMVELEDFKDEWGQTHDEICANLDLDEDDADDILIIDYFWLEENHKWYPKCASTYTEREDKIADYLRHK
jgi:hypothetical protein